jgi:hypothetical protein
MPWTRSSSRAPGTTGYRRRHVARLPSPIQLFDLIMLIGADTAGRPLEIGLASGEFIVPAMAARPKFLR